MSDSFVKYFIYIPVSKIKNSFLNYFINDNIEYIDDFNDSKLLQNICNSYNAHLVVYINYPADPLNFEPVNNLFNLYLKLLKNKYCYFQVSLIGFLSKPLFKLKYKYSDILYLNNLKYYELKRNTFDEIKNSSVQPLDLKHISRELISINVKPLIAYDNHHSITNKWSAYKWIKTLDKNYTNDSPWSPQNELYFNYITTLDWLNYIIKNNSSASLINQIKFEVFDKQHPIKILVVDDDVDKGWDLFWKLYFQKYFNKLKIEYNIHKINNNEANIDIDKLIGMIVAFDPDVIILDLYLLKYEFIKNEVHENLLSLKILNKVKKEINSGIQILIFTAQNNILFFNKLRSVNIDGYVLKEEFNLLGNYKSEIYINQLSENLKYVIERIYLKKFYTGILKIKKILQFNNSQYSFDDVKNEVLNQLNITWNLFNNSHNLIDFINVYLSLQYILEYLNGKLIDFKDQHGNFFDGKTFSHIIEYNKNKKCYHVKPIKVLSLNYSQTIPEGIKFSIIYLYVKCGLLMNEKTDLHPYHDKIERVYRFFSVRNKYVHNKNEISLSGVSKKVISNILELIDFLSDFLMHLFKE